MMISRISSGVSPLRTRARRCIGSSFSAPSAVSRARSAKSACDGRARGGAQTSPQATGVRYAWNGAAYSDALPSVRSTCSSPSTSRRTRSPSSAISPPGRGRRAPGRRRCPPTRGSPQGRAAPRRAARPPARRPRHRSRRPAAPRPSRAPPSSAATRSAISRPPVSSRFARIRSGSASRPSSDSRSHATAEPVERSSSPSGRHSACHEPAARSCSCAIAPSSVAASPGACWAHPNAQIAATGLRLWGMVEDPPPFASRTSATSVCESSTMSRAAFATAPESTASADASSPIRPRCVCQGTAGSASPSSSAYAARHLRAGVAERGERARRAPELRGRVARARISSSQRRASSSPASQPAALSPNVTGTACWSSVRPAIGVSRCARASSAAALAAAPTSSSSGSSARAVTSMAAVSRMSWLVAPRCTCAAAGPSTASVSAALSGTTGLPDPLAPAAIAAASKRSARHAAAIASASPGSINPAEPARAQAPPRRRASPAATPRP